jgi:N-acetylmuramoyl-L-alanine amidase
LVSVAASVAAPARPDRSLFQEARESLASLRASPRQQGRRLEWERVVTRYRRVVARYPQSGYCDDALLAVGDLYREMAKHFKAKHYEDEAVSAYRALVAQYPSSSLGERALFAVFEIAQQGGDRRRVAEAARLYLDAFPDSARAAEVKARVRKAAPAQPLPSPPPPGLARVFNLRFWSGESSTRIVIDVEKEVPFRYDRISDPERLWIDLIGTRLHPNLSHQSFPVGDGLLEQIRLAQNRDSAVRVVLDFKDVREHSIFYLHDPLRLVVDVRGAPRPLVARAAPAAGGPPSPAEPRPEPAAAPQATPERPPGEEQEAEPPPARRTAAEEAPLSSRRVSALAPPAPSPPAQKPRERPTIEGMPVPERRGAAPSPPQANRAGSYSLARQLGLGARRIVIDAGHGGHDPGSIGPRGLQEKDLILDVALRLEKLVRDSLGADVVMTRSTDTFIPLEERTAIANSRGADLFLSIHANSSRNARARGIETYFLNFAQDPHAEAVAARENAISAATLKDLQGLVKAITLNSKIDESRDFAATVQEALVENLKPHYPALQDRGVHTAPFYVLIGAHMPSILAEIAFVSHPEEEKLLRSPEYRDMVARSLLDGIRRYLEALNRTQTRQLTGAARRSTVATGASR